MMGWGVRDGVGGVSVEFGYQCWVGVSVMG